MRKKTGGGIYLGAGVAALIFAFITKNVADNTSHSSSNMYIMGRYVGRSSWGEIYDIVFWIFLLAGIVLLITGIAILSVKDNNETKTDNKSDRVKYSESLFIRCQSCGEENGKTSTRCYKCGASLIPKSKERKPDLNAGEWFCPKCGKINAGYVGTCGCGEAKPR